MSYRLLIRLLLCIFTSAFLLYSYIDKLNEIIELKIEIPKLDKEMAALREKNQALILQIEAIESPRFLIEKSRLPEYSGLKQPSRSKVQIIEVEDGF